MSTQSLHNNVLWERRLAAIRAGEGVYARYGYFHRSGQDLTNRTFQQQPLYFILSVESGSETSFAGEIDATIRLLNRNKVLRSNRR